MEDSMFVCPLPKKCAWLCDYISNSHFLQYFFEVDAGIILLGGTVLLPA